MHYKNNCQLKLALPYEIVNKGAYEWLDINCICGDLIGFVYKDVDTIEDLYGYEILERQPGSNSYRNSKKLTMEELINDIVSLGYTIISHNNIDKYKLLL